MDTDMVSESSNDSWTDGEGGEQVCKESKVVREVQ